MLFWIIIVQIIRIKVLLVILSRVLCDYIWKDALFMQ